MKNNTDRMKNPHKRELSKIRLEYSLHWYDMHNRQRMNLFNFFVVITGILANAYVVAEGKGPELRFVLCLLGAVQSMGFFFFDIRSRQLIKYGEDVLEKLERDRIFPDSFKGIDGTTLGLLRMDDAEGMREGKNKGFRPKKMKVWMRLMHFIVFSAFISGLIIEMLNFPQE